MSTLSLSTRSTRTNPKALNGLRVAVPAYVFVPNESGITKVAFTLDGKAVRTELASPWDFNGTNSTTGRATIFDFTTLSAGSHVITADVTKKGVTTRVTATFTVVKATPPPPPPPPAPVPTVILEAVSPFIVTHTPVVQDLQYVAIAKWPAAT